MRPTPLALILSALSHSNGLVPDGADRETFRAAADAASRTSKPVELIIVAGPDADPVVAEVQTLAEYIDEMQTALYGVRDHVDDLLRVMRQRRHDETASGQPPATGVTP
jgi:hypothetical protein